MDLHHFPQGQILGIEAAVAGGVDEVTLADGAVLGQHIQPQPAAARQIDVAGGGADIPGADVVGTHLDGGIQKGEHLGVVLAHLTHQPHQAIRSDDRVKLFDTRLTSGIDGEGVKAVGCIPADDRGTGKAEVAVLLLDLQVFPELLVFPAVTLQVGHLLGESAHLLLQLGILLLDLPSLEQMPVQAAHMFGNARSHCF